MLNNSLVSIIIPGYNAEDYLDKCISSVVNQTYKNLEIILVDDGSSDSTLSKFNSWAEKDGRIKVLHQENKGLALARNTGISAATGEFVMFADSDDYLENDMVEFLLDLSLKYDADVSRCGFYLDEADKITSASDDEAVKIPDYDSIMTELASGGHISGVAWNKLYKYDVIKSHLYRKEDGCSEDIMHNYRVYKDIKEAVFCNIPKYHYVIRDNSITNSPFNVNAFSIVRAKQIILDGEKDNKNIYPYAVKGFITSAFIVLSGCITNNACMDKYDDLRKSIIQYKDVVLKSNLYSRLDKLKIVLLKFSPKLYNMLIKIKG